MKARDDIAANIDAAFLAHELGGSLTIFGVMETDDGTMIANVEGTCTAADLRLVADVLQVSEHNEVALGWVDRVRRALLAPFRP